MNKKKIVSITISIFILTILLFSFNSFFKKTIPITNFAIQSNETNNSVQQKILIKNETAIINFSKKESSLIIQNFRKKIYLTKNIEKTILLTINNTGEKDLTNITLNIKNIENSYYTISPTMINLLKKKETANFKIIFLITDFFGKKNISYEIKTNASIKMQSIEIEVLKIKEYFLEELREFSKTKNKLKQKIENSNKIKLLKKLDECENLTKKIIKDIEIENFINAKDNLDKTNKCIDDVNYEFKHINKITILKTKMTRYIKGVTTEIIIIILILIFIASLLFTIYLIYKKTNILNFIKLKQNIELNQKINEQKSIKDITFDDKLKKIEDKLKE
jgi:hypothetical protein